MKKQIAPKEGDLRIWWIPQVPMHPFRIPVSDPTQAAKILDVLADYDIFQFKNRIKPDYCNAGGLEVFEGGEWVEWEEAETGCDISEFAEQITEKEEN
jgi:hypothetical protein